MNCLSSNLQEFVFQVENHIFFLREEANVGHSGYVIALSAHDLVQRERVFSGALDNSVLWPGWHFGMGKWCLGGLYLIQVCVCLLASGACVHG